MTTTTATGQTAQTSAPTLGVGASIAKANEEAGERFLKLLMTQIQNQDPLNPMDNAQLTTQMAQINTVAGIERLNTTMTKMAGGLAALDSNAGLTKLQESLTGSLQGLTTQMRQSQALQGAALVGRAVWIAGDALPVNAGTARGSFELRGAADAVTVEVLASSGHVLDRIDLGARSSGRVQFGWPAPEGVPAEGLKYRVIASAGSASVASDLHAQDTVSAVSAGADGLVLQLARTGATPIDRVKAFN